MKKWNVFMSLLMLFIGYFFSSLMTIVFAIFGTFIGNILYNHTIVTVLYFTLVSIISLVGYFSWLKKRKKYHDGIFSYNVYYVFAFIVLFTVLFSISKASLLNPMMSFIYIFAFPFMFTMTVFALFANTYWMMVSIGCVLLVSLLYSLWILSNKKLWVTSVISVVCAICCVFTYLCSPNYKYRNPGHNFGYMSGYSSVDLYDYALYNENHKLVTIDSTVEMIENVKDMPVLDGAEACYPVYGAIAKALYKDIETIERSAYLNSKYENGEVVTFHNTAIGFERLLNDDVDMFFGAKPSKSQLELATEMHKELEYTAIGKEGFVFFVNEDNPIDNLTSQQIKDIYSGKITNWKEVGGNNEKIIAFQRPERSGSQSMMVYFMGDTTLKEPLTYEMEYAMMGIIEEVAQYHNEAGAIGYSFRYYFDEMTKVEGTKMIAVDGVYPSTDTIVSGEYPLVTSLYCITVKDNTNPNVKKVLEFMLSEEGQRIIEETGYCPVK